MMLYFAPRTRAVRPRWLFEELSVPYDLVRVDMKARQHKDADFMRLHPHGQLPVLVDKGVPIFESTAICLYLADKFIDKGLAPAFDASTRGLYYQWMVYACATAEPPVARYFKLSRAPEAERSQVALDEARQQFKEVARVLSDVLSRQSFVLKEGFSAVDVLMGSILIWADSLGLLEGETALQNYAEQMKRRPAYLRATAT